MLFLGGVGSADGPFACLCVLRQYVNIKYRHMKCIFYIYLGRKGEEGSCGLPGQDGLPGAPGPPGDQGHVGEQGYTGPQGRNGCFFLPVYHPGME